MCQRIVLRSTTLLNSVLIPRLRELTNGARRLSQLRELERTIEKFPPNISPEGVQVLPISAEVCSQLANTMKSLPSPHTHFEDHCSASYSTILSQLPPSSVDVIRGFPSSPSIPGALLITGLPLDPALPCTPMNGERSPEKRSFVSEGCLTGIAKLIGEPYPIATEKNGEVIHDICPVRHHEVAQSNESSRVDLSLHVENAYFNVRPDYLALYCLRQDYKKEAYTSVADVRSILLRMDLIDVMELQKPLFVVPSPASHHEAMGGEKWSSPRPLLENVSNPRLICHFPGMKALEPGAQRALNMFEKTARQLAVVRCVALPPGSILLLNNRTVAHGRSCFQPRYDGHDRWLQRVYIRAIHDTFHD